MRNEAAGHAHTNTVHVAHRGRQSSELSGSTLLRQRETPGLYSPGVSHRLIQVVGTTVPNRYGLVVAIAMRVARLCESPADHVPDRNRRHKRPSLFACHRIEL